MIEIILQTATSNRLVVVAKGQVIGGCFRKVDLVKPLILDDWSRYISRPSKSRFARGRRHMSGTLFPLLSNIESKFKATGAMQSIQNPCSIDRRFHHWLSFSNRWDKQVAKVKEIEFVQDEAMDTSTCSRPRK